MTTSPATAVIDRYRADYEELSRRLAGEPPWLRDLRQQAWAVFQDSGFPTATRGNERWKYTPVSPLARNEFAYPFGGPGERMEAERLHHLDPWGPGWTTLFFVDGHFAPHLSFSHGTDPGVTVTTLAEAIAEHPGLVQSNLGRLVDLTLDGFHALNSAFLNNGAVIHIPAGCEMTSPIHCAFIASGAIATRTAAVFPRVLTVLGEQARATLVESYIGLGEAANFTDAIVEVSLGQGAKLAHYRLLMESAASYHVGMTRVHGAAGSSYNATSFARGAALGRHDLHVALDGEGASCDLRGLYVTSGRQHIDHHINVDHLQPNTRSTQYFKGILAGSSHAVFSGRVLVVRGAQKSEAHQTDRNLLLSEGCEIDSKPSLEIYADDVQCTHGATAGSVADEELFYMRARGLDLETATRSLVRGFASEITDAITLAPLQAYLEAWITGSIPELHQGTTP